MTTLVDLLTEAREVETPQGTAVVVETRLPASRPHGGSTPAALRGPVGRGLAELGGAELATGQDLAEAVFLDVESTGLGAGAGTYAFLVGLARLTKDGEVVLRQHFLSGPEQEAAWAHLLDEDLACCPLLVTFNGRSFDVPLLHTRFILQRRSLPMLASPHVDLMRPARRLWRHQLASCALVSLEENLLGLPREDDIPGREIPGIYLEYLQSGVAEPLLPVIRHNALDVLSMLTLAIRIRALLDPDTPTPPDHPAEWLGLGHCHDHLGEYALAERAFQEASHPREGAPVRIRHEALRRLSRLHKRHRDWHSAEPLWRDLIQRAHPDGVYPYEELAKHLEHREHRFADALELVDAALYLLATGRLTCRRDRETVCRSLEHRQQRLVRRLLVRST